MTTPDTKAIRAQIEALSGFAPGPWIYYADLPSVEPNWHIVTTSNKMRVLANVHIEPGNAMDVANASLIAAAPDMRATILALCDALEDERAKCDEWADRAMTELGNVLDLRAENERLRSALTKINVGDGWAAQIARAALAEKGGE